MEAGLPRGIVTFLFSDIEGSTRLLRRIGDVAAQYADEAMELATAAGDGRRRRRPPTPRRPP
jgi:class 3 adenylate cyclase